MEYAKCLVELNEILNHLEKEYLEKIPYDIRKAIIKKKDKQYNWSYDETKELNEQNINRKTIAMLSYLNMEYLLNDEQKKLMKELHKANERKAERKKQEKYNSFSNVIEDEKIEPRKEVALVEVKPQKWYEKIFSILKGTFKK